MKMERRLLFGWSTMLVLLVPLIFQLPRQASGAPFNYMAHCRDMDTGRNSLFVFTVRQFGDSVATTYNLHFGKGLAPPRGINRLVRMFYRLREVRDKDTSIEQLIAEVEKVFLSKLERLESYCKRQIHG